VLVRNGRYDQKKKKRTPSGSHLAIRSFILPGSCERLRDREIEIESEREGSFAKPRERERVGQSP
jgi:hypothetical protein